MGFLFEIVGAENSLAIQGDHCTGDTAILVVDTAIEKRKLELAARLTIKLDGFDFRLAFIADKRCVIQQRQGAGYGV